MKRLTTLMLLLPVLLGFMGMTACSGGTSGHQNVPVVPPPPPPPPPAPLGGSPSSLAVDVIDDVYIEGPTDPAEYSEDPFGRQIHRVGLKIVFLETATVADVNEVLIDQSAEIVASLAGFPALVVRIPDPGSLFDLDVVVAEIEAEPAVHSVIYSQLIQTRGLPENYVRRIFDQSFPAGAAEWGHLRHQLAIRAPAAWELQSFAQSRPSVVLPDYFGAGEAENTIFDFTYLPGETRFDFGNAIPPRVADEHGYAMLSIITSEHSSETETSLPDFTTGVVPVGVRLAVVDKAMAYTEIAFQTELMKTVRDAVASTNSTIVVNYSLGPNCMGFSVSDPCLPRAVLQNEVINFIREVRHIGAENRVLFVAAAGNVPSGSTAQVEPTDAESSSHINASTLMDGWTDLVTGEVYPRLTNVLVVENAATDVTTLPVLPGCITESSFIGGHIAGIGMDVFAMTDPRSTAGLFGLDPQDPDEIADGGTSAATAQVSGVAAYLAALNPSWSPQDIFRILTKTGLPFTGEALDCSPLFSTVILVDAYAGALSIDPPGVIDPQQTRARMHLLDITNAALEDDAPDGKFNIHDLTKWANVLTDEFLADKDKYYSRYDLNGDGVAGVEGGTSPFDLDISFDPTSNTSTAYGAVQFNNLGSLVTYDENNVTDAQIVCYYANTALYELVDFGPFTAESRDEELEKLRTQCGPLAISVSPSEVSLEPGQTQQFSATVAGATDTSVTWTATGGTIDANGLYTAGSVDGSYMVTATSNADNTVSGSAIVDIDAPAVNITVSVSPASVTLSPGDTQQFSATVTGATDTSVTWSASGGTIDSAGLYTATGSDGSYTVTATSNADPSVSDQATVAIQSGLPADVSGSYEAVGDVFTLFRGRESLIRSGEPLTIVIDQQGSSVNIEVSAPSGFIEPNVYIGTRDDALLSAISSDCDPRPGNECPFDATMSVETVIASTGVLISGRFFEDDPDDSDLLGGTGSRFVDFEIFFVPE